MQNTDPFFMLSQIDIAMKGLKGEKILRQISKINRERLTLLFESGPLKFICPLENCGEVQKVPQITKLPGTQRWIRGLIYWRGEVATVVDLNEFFCGQKTQESSTNRVILFEKDHDYFAILVEKIEGMRRISHQLPKINHIGAKERSQMLNHRIRIEDDDYILLNLTKLTKFMAHNEDK